MSIYHCQSIISHIYHLYSKKRLYSEKKIEQNYEKSIKYVKNNKNDEYLNKKWPPTLFLVHIGPILDDRLKEKIMKP